MAAKSIGSPEAARDPFSAAKDRYLLAVAENCNIHEAATKVAIVLTVSFTNREEFDRTGRLTAWPSTRKLAEKTGMFRGRIDRAIGSLESEGLLQVSRPEKRGATHYNKYVLIAGIGRTDEANSETAIGLTTVANSIGRTDEANSKIEADGIGLTDEAALASPVEPKSLEELPEGDGAPSGAPRSPVQGRDQVSSEIETEETVNGDFVAPEGDQSPSSSAISSDEESPANPASDEEPFPELDPEDCDLRTITDAPPPNEIADQWAEADEQQEAPDPTEGMPDDWPGEDVPDDIEDDAMFFNHIAFATAAACPMIETPADLLAIVAMPVEAWQVEFRNLLPTSIAKAFAEAPAARAGAVRHLRRAVSCLLEGDDLEADRLVYGLMHRVDVLTQAKARAATKSSSNVEEAAYG